MAFTKENLTYAQQYMQALAAMYPYVLYFGKLRANNQSTYRFVDARTIQIPSLSTSGRVDASRDTIGAKARRYNNSWTSLTLSQQRCWDTLVHPMDINQTNQVASIANITKIFNEQQKFPEMDAYMISKLYADYIAAGKVPYSMTLTTSNVLTQFDTMMENATNHRVPAVGRILYVDPETETLLKQAQGINRNLSVQDGNSAINRAVSSLDTVEISVVPRELLKTVYNFTEGWAVGASAKQIKMLLIHPSCLIAPVSYETVLLDPPSAGTGGKWSYYEESFEDVFLLPFREDALEFVLEDISLPELTFTSTASSTTTGYTKLAVTSPAKKTGNKYFYTTHATAITLPGYGDSVSGWTEWDGDDEIAVTNGYKIALVEFNKDGRAVVGKVIDAASKTE